MARYAVKISKEDFQKKLIEAIKKHEECDSYVLDDLQETDGEINYSCSYIIRSLNKKVDKDLGKVMFDLENFECSDHDSEHYGYPLGIQTLDNGFTFLGCAAGGDWEYPVFFIIYWDGTTFRGYIPSDGNRWNKKYKTAYGSEEESSLYDEDNLEEDETIGDPNGEPDSLKIKEDIKKRIIIK